MASAYVNGLRPEDIDDLVELTLHKFDKDRWVDISLSMREYFAYENMLLRDRIGVDGGDQLQWQVKVRNAGSAKMTGMYATDDVKVADVMKHCNLSWKKATCNMAYDIDEEGFNSPSAVRIANMINVRRHAALTDFAELLEERFWGLPYDTTSDSEVVKPHGVPYWIVRNATKGFNGALPIVASGYSGHSSVGGLSPSTYANWRNYTGQFAAISKRDLVRLLREATVKCNFKAPVSHPSPVPQSPRYVIATVYDVIARMEEIAEQQNQNLGNDVASKDGQALFRRIPMHAIPYLENNHDSTAADANNPYGKNPVYGIDKGAFRMVFQTGKFMRRTAPIIAPSQHSVRHIHWDSWFNFQCLNRRSNFVLTQSA